MQDRERLFKMKHEDDIDVLDVVLDTTSCECQYDHCYQALEAEHWHQDNAEIEIKKYV